MTVLMGRKEPRSNPGFEDERHCARDERGHGARNHVPRHDESVKTAHPSWCVHTQHSNAPPTAAANALSASTPRNPSAAKVPRKARHHAGGRTTGQPGRPGRQAFCRPRRPVAWTARWPQLGIARNEVFVSNAVKHFKFELRGKRRIHKSPTQREIAACLHIGSKTRSPWCNPSCWSPWAPLPPARLLGKRGAGHGQPRPDPGA
jgi:hypothetical protein